MPLKPEVVSVRPSEATKSTCHAPSRLSTRVVSSPLVKQASVSSSAMATSQGASFTAKWGAFSALPAKWVTLTRTTLGRGAVKVTSSVAPLRMSPRPRTGRQAASTCRRSSPLSTRTHCVA